MYRVAVFTEKRRIFHIGGHHRRILQEVPPNYYGYDYACLHPSPELLASGVVGQAFQLQSS